MQSPHFNFFNEVHVFHCHTNEKIPIVIIDSNIVTAGFMRAILRNFIVTPKNASGKARREGGMRFFLGDPFVQSSIGRVRSWQ